MILYYTIGLTKPPKKLGNIKSTLNNNEVIFASNYSCNFFYFLSCLTITVRADNKLKYTFYSLTKMPWFRYVNRIRILMLIYFVIRCITRRKNGERNSTWARMARTKKRGSYITTAMMMITMIT